MSYVLAGFVAGFRWTPASEDWTADLPRAVPTVSDCLTDFLPADQDIEPWQQPLFAPWHRSLHQAATAVRHAPPEPRTAHVLSMSVPATGATGLATLIEEWIGDLPHPIRMNLARPTAAPPGTVHGFEVLGFDIGLRLHSWLCYRLDTQALAKLGIRPGDSALLTTLDDAQRVADMANDNHGTHDGTPEDITWIPALITEHDIDEVPSAGLRPADETRCQVG
ncbi:hypothetical protein OOJ91_03755 [Micromonospora lupini]|uniref:hypothetical protein n=1 Tax=Micromonospora lupini TaxID=285679 RepID=UPI0022585F09|nr:hypothetical protein [Micromonospora lupini]MCX5064990.1 hypothetical protein [Micromonospora lupini]